MGSFKRHSKKNKRRKKRKEATRRQTPPDFLRFQEILAGVWTKLHKEKIIQSFSRIVFHRGQNILLSSLSFSSRIKPKRVRVFYSKTIHKSELMFSEGKNGFDLLIHSEATEEELYQLFKYYLSILLEGFEFEETLVKKLNEYFQDKGIKKQCRIASQEEDEKEKIDIVISYASISFGIQIKKGLSEWLNHKKKYPKVSSILVPHTYSIRNIVEAIDTIEKSIQKGDSCHVNIFKNSKSFVRI